METKTTQENSEACAGLAAAPGSAFDVIITALRTAQHNIASSRERCDETETELWDYYQNAIIKAQFLCAKITIAMTRLEESEKPFYAGMAVLNDAMQNSEVSHER